MLSIPKPMRARAKLHRHHLHMAKEIGEVGVAEDAEDEEVQAKEVEAKDNRQHQVVARGQDSHRINHRDKHSRQDIFHIPATTVVDMDTGPKTVQVSEVYEDVVEEEEVAIVGDVPEAEAGDVKQATRAWLQTAKLRVLEPSQHLHIRRETSEAPDWPVQWTDGACTPELSKPIWRGSKIGEEDLIIAHAEKEATQAETSTVPVCQFCDGGSNTSS